MRQTAASVMRIIHGFAGMYGFKRKELATICGITPQTWAERERNPASFKLGELEKLAKSFGVQLTEIIGGQGGGCK